MRKKTLMTLALLPILTIQAQVGINTNNPLAAFHIDGKGDNSKAPTSDQTVNDVVVTTDGHVGIGTIEPAVSLDIKTAGVPASPKAGFKLVDGNEGAGKFLVSDASGVATWKSGETTKLKWNNNVDRRFTIPHDGMYLITLYLDDNNDPTLYTNTATLSISGNPYNGLALYSETRQKYLIANSNNFPTFGVSCSGTVFLRKGEIVKPGSIFWMQGLNDPVLGVEIIPL